MMPAMRDLFEADTSLHRFTPDDIAAIIAAGHRRDFAPGELVLAEGDAGDSMFVVDRGEVEIRLPVGDAFVLGAGSYFGELSFINPDHRRSASIYARGETTLTVLDQRSIATLSKAHPHALLTLLRRTCAFLVDKEESLIAELRDKNVELEQTLDFLRRTREELDYQELMAQTDVLTALYNRRCLDQQLPKFVQRAGPGPNLALIMIDLDHFKPINDTLGHPAGDLVLRSVGRVLRSHVRRTDLPVRLGGDEFCVVLADVDEAQARARAESLRQGIATMPHPGQDLGLRVTGSLGGTLYQLGEPIAAFVGRADRVLYEAKEAGRNCLCWAGVSA
jgi:diguanylate cyclase (GGDEF)-like protein